MMEAALSEAWRRTLDGRSKSPVAVAQREWLAWPDVTLGERDQERRIVAGRYQTLTAKECGLGQLGAG